jgi:lysyl-tRNA synthetase class I
LGRKDDGSYERNGIKFVVAQGKRGGVRRPKKTAPKKDATIAEHNAAIRRAIGGSRTTEQGTRIEQKAREQLERSTSEDLRERVDTARAWMDAELQPQARAQDHARKNKRKADALEEDEDSEGFVDTRHGLKERVNEKMEKAATAQNSMLDIARE